MESSKRQCKKCEGVKDISEFRKHSCGFCHTCIKCSNKQVGQWAKNNKAARNVIVQRSRAKTKVWRDYSRKWQKDNGTVAKRRSKLSIATPIWLDIDHKWMIREAHSLRKLRELVTGVKHNVDHIVPIMSDIVCGLHVPWNLQVITARENNLKGNKITQNF